MSNNILVYIFISPIIIAFLVLLCSLLAIVHEIIKVWIKGVRYWKSNPPVYRIDILNAVKEGTQDYTGLCAAIMGETHNKIPYIKLYNVRYLFPAFKDDYHIKACNGNPDSLYWWRSNVWNTGRLDYLNWLIDKYKYDKTNLLNPFYLTKVIVAMYL